MRKRPKDTVAKEEDTGAKEEGRLPRKKRRKTQTTVWVLLSTS
jgi:hypothetical protein